MSSDQFARECRSALATDSADAHRRFVTLNAPGLTGYSTAEISHGQRCYRCDQIGHIARECSSHSDIRTCFNCGQHGHIRSECTAPLHSHSPSKASAQCYRCGQFGHFARDCAVWIEGGGAQNDRVCFKCARSGHIAATCPDSSRTDMRDVVCYCCNRLGHLSRDCPNSTLKCYSCGSTGHMARDCFDSRAFEQHAPAMHSQFYVLQSSLMN